MKPLKTLLAAAAIALATALLSASPAAAAQPCWHQVQNDWYRHGQVLGTYPVHCYVEAIRNLPEDSKVYSSAADDIRNSMLLAIRNDKGGDRGDKSGGAFALGANDGFGGGTGSKSAFNRVLDVFGPKNADAIPLPLLILAGVAFLLLAAGGASLVARRLHARRVVPAPAPAREPRK